MQGAIEVLLSGLLFRGLGPVVSGILMAAPLKKVARAQLKKIYVLDERGEMAGEYILDSDCPIDYNDFLKVLPDEGIGDRDSLFVGEYVFTAVQSGKVVFVLLARGPRGLFDPTAGRGRQRGLPIREDPRNRGTTRGEFQRRFEEGGVESQFRRATGVRAGAEGTHRGEGRSRDSIPRGFDADRETREGGEGIGRRPRERTGRGRSPGRRGRQDPPRDREPRGRSEPTFHFDGERAPRRVSSPSGRSLRGSSEGDGGREGRARPGTQVPSTEGDRAPRSRGASPGSRGAGRRTGP